MENENLNEVAEEIAENMEIPTENTECVGEEESQSEVETLRAALAEREREFADLFAQNERYAAEFAAFRKEFPNVPLSAIDDGLLAQMRGGVPLAAAYALALHREQKNEQTRKNRWQGPIGSADESYFTCDEVKNMSQSEVKKNFARIKESMRRW